MSTGTTVPLSMQYGMYILVHACRHKIVSRVKVNCSKKVISTRVLKQNICRISRQAGYTPIALVCTPSVMEGHSPSRCRLFDFVCLNFFTQYGSASLMNAIYVMEMQNETSSKTTWGYSATLPRRFLDRFLMRVSSSAPQPWSSGADLAWSCSRKSMAKLDWTDWPTTMVASENAPHTGHPDNNYVWTTERSFALP